MKKTSRGTRRSTTRLSTVPTPFYLIDERRLVKNLEIVARVKELSGVKSVLALKCFAAWAVFPLMKRYMAGTTSSSLFETRLGAEKFGGETHAFSVAWPRHEIRELRKYADKVIFNSVGQLEAFRRQLPGIRLGLRVNPGFSFSHFDLADPSRKYSRLGVSDGTALKKSLPYISGVMFHYNCENDDIRNFSLLLDRIAERYGRILEQLEWVSLGGGFYFTKPGYPLDRFCAKLREFSSRFGVQVYLEPGETAITGAAELVTSVLDVVHNRREIAIVDASTEAHMLDLLIYRQSAKMEAGRTGKREYIVAGRSCLAGDVFGAFRFPGRLKPGDRIGFFDAAGYTMVKKNWFNGLPMPSIAVRRLDGSVEIVRKFDYIDFRDNLS